MSMPSPWSWPIPLWPPPTLPTLRTNLAEFGLRLDTDNPLRGRTLNPWNPNLTPGGSSGGDAAALATGMTPFGLGNDMGGSLRFPAYCCGIAALKPTAGRLPSARSIEPQDLGLAMQILMVEGPMARTVEDLQLGLSVLVMPGPCAGVSKPAGYPIWNCMPGVLCLAGPGRSSSRITP